MTGNKTQRQELREAKFNAPMRAIKKHNPNRAKVVEYSFEEEVEQYLDPHLTNPRRIREQEEKDKVTAECDRVSAQLDTKLSEQVRNASPPRDSAFPIGSVAEARLSAQDALAKTVPPCVTTMDIKAFVSRKRASDPCARVAET